MKLFLMHLWTRIFHPDMIGGMQRTTYSSPKYGKTTSEVLTLKKMQKLFEETKNLH